MARYFLDTSALVKRYVSEVGSAWVPSITDPVAANQCRIVAIARVELLAALYRRARSGAITSVTAKQTDLVFRHELSSIFQVINVGTIILDRAMTLVASHPWRAYDAVQLAAAAEIHSRDVALGLPPPIFISADTDLNLAAASEGLPVDDPNMHP